MYVYIEVFNHLMNSRNNSVKQLKHCLARAILHSANGFDANKAQGKAECFISTLSTHLMFYNMYSTGSNALTNYIK